MNEVSVRHVKRYSWLTMQAPKVSKLVEQAFLLHQFQFLFYKNEIDLQNTCVPFLTYHEGLCILDLRLGFQSQAIALFMNDIVICWGVEELIEAPFEVVFVM